jgi:hypothetical protein
VATSTSVIYVNQLEGVVAMVLTKEEWPDLLQVDERCHLLGRLVDPEYVHGGEVQEVLLAAHFQRVVGPVARLVEPSGQGHSVGNTRHSKIREKD